MKVVGSQGGICLGGGCVLISCLLSAPIRHLLLSVHYWKTQSRCFNRLSVLRLTSKCTIYYEQMCSLAGSLTKDLKSWSFPEKCIASGMFEIKRLSFIHPWNDTPVCLHTMTHFSGDALTQFFLKRNNLEELSGKIHKIRKRHHVLKPLLAAVIFPILTLGWSRLWVDYSGTVFYFRHASYRGYRTRWI